MIAIDLIECLKATLHPDSREAAEKKLSEAYTQLEFVPTLLQVVMSDTIDRDVRLSGVVYLKNTICQYWSTGDANEPAKFTIHESDKAIIRDNIVEALIPAPSYIVIQLSVCITQILKQDFPSRWPTLITKINMYLRSEQHETWMGSLICLYNLVKYFEYKKNEERDALNEPMKELLPLLHQRAVQLNSDDSELATNLQKQILKIFSALTQFYLPLELISQEVFTQWMELLRVIIEKDMPKDLESVEIDERPELPFWKVKKWALNIVYRCFERYGSPSNVHKIYKSFANFFIKSFSHGILTVCFKLLEKYCNKVYVSPRVLQLTLNYLNEGIGHSFSWKIIKPHMNQVLEQIVLPLLCHSDEDEELWTSDPVEYIRVKYDTFEEYFSPVTAAQGLLHTAATGRKEMLPKILSIIVTALGNPDMPPPQKAGVLQAIGAIADLLLGKKELRDQAEALLVTHVFPEFQSQYGYLRARACWVIHHFFDVKFSQPQNLEKVVLMLRTLLVQDTELPVKVEAAIALQAVLIEQDNVKEMLTPHIKDIVIVLLDVVRETINEDVTTVLQKFVCRFGSDIAPLAFDITTHLAQTFITLLESEAEPSDERAITAMGLLSTMETMVIVLEEEAEVLMKVEEILMPVIAMIMQQDCMEFYEEMLSLVGSLTSVNITDNMWRLYPMMYEFFKKDNIEYFSEMAPAIHNYITNGADRFLSNTNNIEMVFNMCKDIMASLETEQQESYAAKLLEVMILQFMGKIDFVVPSIVELALERLTRKIETAELRTMCLEVVIASLYYNPVMLMQILEKVHLPNSNESITLQFLNQWISDTNCFFGLHDRKLSVIGLCTLISFPENLRPGALLSVCTQILPVLVVLFTGLDKSYERFAELKAAEEDEEDEEAEEEEEEYGDDVVGDEEDVLNEDSFYMQNIDNSKTGETDEEEEDYDEDEYDQTPLESYDTVFDGEETDIDEYLVFKQTLQSLLANDPDWYYTLTSSLNDQQKEKIEKIFRTADQRYAAKESKKIEEAGGYKFDSGDVPNQFNFAK